MATLEQVLGYDNLTSLAVSVRSGLPKVLPAQLYNVSKRVSGNVAKYRKVSGTREVARLVQYGSPSKASQQKGVSEVTVRLIHSSEHVWHDPDTLIALQQLDNASKQKLGQQEIARQTREFAMRFTNLRTTAIASAFSLGAIYFDSDGNLLPSSSGATYTIDMDIPSANKNQIDGIIAASWATSSTDIAGDIQAIKRKALQTTGYPLRYAIYGLNILNYLLGNDTVKELIPRNAAYNESALAGAIKNGFMGLDWIDGSNAFFVDSSGSVQQLVGDDTVIFLPDPSPDWYELIEGSVPVPTSIDVASDAVTALRNVTEVYGMYSYASVEKDPVTIKQVSGDTFLPVIKVPAAVFIADVTP